MIKILKIVPLRFKKQYSTVFFERDISIKAHEDLVAQFHLHEGLEMSEEDLENLKASEERKEALEYAYLFLSYRTRSSREMQDRLTRKGFGKEVVHHTLEDLKQKKLLDDVEFTKTFVEGRLRHRLEGEHKIQRELYNKGIDRETAAEILRTVKEEGKDDLPDEEERAFRSLMRRARQIKEIDSHTQHRRLYGHLARQGFSPDVIEKALNRYRREKKQPDPSENFE